MAGGGGDSPIERLVTAACRACAHDTIERSLMADGFEHIVVATDDAAWASTLTHLPIKLDVQEPSDHFHFGRRLAGLVERYRIERLLYVGGASMPLVAPSLLTDIARQLQTVQAGVVTNNIHSSDWAGIVPARLVVQHADSLPTDNALGWVLWRQAGLAPQAWPASAATLLDVDTPVDAQIAAVHPACGPRLRACMRGLGWDDSRLRAARAVLLTASRQVILAGRVPQTTWAHLENRTLCWLRVFSEERGMRASQRLAQGKVRSLLAEYLNQVGVAGFFDTLAQLADAVFMDSRVLMAARGGWPSPADRFYSDLFQVEKISDPFLRQFTQGALDAAVPVVLGGHALVAGGLWALLEATDEHERRETHDSDDMHR